MSTYTHIEHGGTYRRSPHTVKVKLSGDSEWAEGVAYYSIDGDLTSTLMFVTDERRWAERFRKNPPPTEEEWAETVRAIGGVDTGELIDDTNHANDSTGISGRCPECGYPGR